MKQRINLYNTNKSKAKFDPYSFTGSSSIAIATIALCLLLGGGLSVYANLQQNQIAELKATKKNIDEQVVTEQERFTNQKARPELLAEQARLQEDIASRQQLKALLHRVQPANGNSFSTYLSALADASLPQSWFTSFRLDNQEQSFVAQGVAVDGPDVPLMLEAIGRTEIFQGMSVDQLKVKSTPKGILFDVTAELRAYE